MYQEELLLSTPMEWYARLQSFSSTLIDLRELVDLERRRGHRWLRPAIIASAPTERHRLLPLVESSTAPTQCLLQITMIGSHCVVVCRVYRPGLIRHALHTTFLVRMWLYRVTDSVSCWNFLTAPLVRHFPFSCD
jgi:hypothetical protein